MSTRNSTKKVIEQIRADLFSTDEKSVLASLALCRDQGDLSLVEPLILLYTRTASDEVRSTVADMLSSIKVTGSEDHFMSALANPELRPFRKDLLSFMWQAGLQPIGWLIEITQMVNEGSIEEVIECITLVESIEDDFPEELVLESVQKVRQYLSNAPAEQKSNLVAAYLGVLEQRSQD